MTRILSAATSPLGDFFRMSGCMRFDTPIRELMTVPVTTGDRKPEETGRDACPTSHHEALVERVQSLLDRS